MQKSLMEYSKCPKRKKWTPKSLHLQRTGKKWGDGTEQAEKEQRIQVTNTHKGIRGGVDTASEQGLAKMIWYKW